jgi:alanine transaminase
MVIINPGNPTGAVLSEHNIRNLIDIAARYNIAIIADEVYQENVFTGKFYSFKKMLCTMQKEQPGKYDRVHLASIHSTSKGLIGECGQRGGYMEMYGFDDYIVDSVYKLASINLCSVVTGQALIELMVNPPKPGDESYDLFKTETTSIYNTLRERARRLYTAFQKMEGVTCNEPMGAMYLFPQIQLPQSAGEAAQAAGFDQVDEFYCMELLNDKGICVIPGSGFGQQPNTLHFRTTFLAPGDDVGDMLVDFHRKFMAKYK